MWKRLPLTGLRLWTELFAQGVPRAEDSKALQMYNAACAAALAACGDGLDVATLGESERARLRKPEHEGAVGMGEPRGHERHDGHEGCDGRPRWPAHEGRWARDGRRCDASEGSARRIPRLHGSVCGERCRQSNNPAACTIN